MIDPYRILGITEPKENISVEIIKRARLKQSIIWDPRLHPDNKEEAEKRLLQIEEAYNSVISEINEMPIGHLIESVSNDDILTPEEKKGYLKKLESLSIKSDVSMIYFEILSLKKSKNNTKKESISVNNNEKVDEHNNRLLRIAKKRNCISVMILTYISMEERQNYCDQILNSNSVEEIDTILNEARMLNESIINKSSDGKRRC